MKKFLLLFTILLSFLSCKNELSQTKNNKYGSIKFQTVPTERMISAIDTTLLMEYVTSLNLTIYEIQDKEEIPLGDPRNILNQDYSTFLYNLPLGTYRVIVEGTATIEKTAEDYATTEPQTITYDLVADQIVTLSKEKGIQTVILKPTLKKTETGMGSFSYTLSLLERDYNNYEATLTKLDPLTFTESTDENDIITFKNKTDPETQEITELSLAESCATGGFYIYLNKRENVPSGYYALSLKHKGKELVKNNFDYIIEIADGLTTEGYAECINETFNTYYAYTVNDNDLTNYAIGKGFGCFPQYPINFDSLIKQLTQENANIRMVDKVYPVLNLTDYIKPNQNFEYTILTNLYEEADWNNVNKFLKIAFTSYDGNKLNITLPNDSENIDLTLTKDLNETEEYETEIVLPAFNTGFTNINININNGASFILDFSNNSSASNSIRNFTINSADFANYYIAKPAVTFVNDTDNTHSLSLKEEDENYLMFTKNLPSDTSASGNTEYYVIPLANASTLQTSAQDNTITTKQEVTLTANTNGSSYRWIINNQEQTVEDASQNTYTYMQAEEAVEGTPITIICIIDNQTIQTATLTISNQ